MDESRSYDQYADKVNVLGPRRKVAMLCRIDGVSTSPDLLLVGITTEVGSLRGFRLSVGRLLRRPLEISARLAPRASNGSTTEDEKSC